MAYFASVATGSFGTKWTLNASLQEPLHIVAGFALLEIIVDTGQKTRTTSDGEHPAHYGTEAKIAPGSADMVRAQDNDSSSDNTRSRIERHQDHSVSDVRSLPMLAPNRLPVSG